MKTLTHSRKNLHGFFPNNGAQGTNRICNMLKGYNNHHDKATNSSYLVSPTRKKKLYQVTISQILGGTNKQTIMVRLNFIGL